MTRKHVEGCTSLSEHFFFLDAGPFWFFSILTWLFFFWVSLTAFCNSNRSTISPRWCKAWTQSTYVSLILVGWMLDVRCVLFCLIAFLFLLAMKCPPLSLFFCLFFFLRVLVHASLLRLRFFHRIEPRWTTYAKAKWLGGGDTDKEIEMSLLTTLLRLKKKKKYIRTGNSFALPCTQTA